MSIIYHNFIGVDIGKLEFVVNIFGSKRTYAFSNDFDGFKQFYLKFQSILESGFVVLEVTGGYERELAYFLYQNKVALHRANGRQVKNFIRSYGIMGKNDNIDAANLALYAQERHPRLKLFEPNPHDCLRELYERRNDLVKMRVQERNRMQSPGSLKLKESCKAVIEILDSQISLLDKEITNLIESSPELLLKIKAMKTVPGIGEITASAIVAQMPEIGEMNQKQVASLAGVAPHPNQSGTRDGYRRTKGGRRQMRPMLFMSALAASRTKSSLGEFYCKLTANGKSKMCALTALMRKIVVIANARIKEEKAIADI